MAGTFADYVVVTAGKTDLSIGGVKEFFFNIPKGMAGAPSILWLMVHTNEEADDLMATVSINGHKVWTYGATDTNLTRAFHEVFKPNVLKVGSNTLKVQVVSGEGVFRVHDIVIWFQNSGGSFEL